MSFTYDVYHVYEIYDVCIDHYHVYTILHE